MRSPPPVIIDYADPNSTSPHVGLYRAAIFFAAAPLVLGFSCLAGYAVTQLDVFVALGILTIFFGFVCVVIGGICLFVYIRECRKLRDVRPMVLAVRATIAIALLLSNFPSAMFCYAKGVKLVFTDVD